MSHSQDLRSTQAVIPAQFVLFNLSAIIGSAVLYGDFRKATLHQMVTFLYGCAATFSGVFILTSSAPVASGGDTERGEAQAAGGEVRRVQIVGAAGQVRARPTSILRKRESRVSLVGLSPAQRVLLVRSGPSDSNGELE